MSDESTPRRAPTRNDVAELAQVSTAVVSYVITGAKRVAPETAERVRAAIAELGYRPNYNARALRTGRSQTLALLVPDIGNPYFAEFASHLETAAADRGLALVIANTHGDEATEIELREAMRSRGVDGLMVASVLRADQQPPHGDGGLPTVLIDAFQPADGVSSIGFDGATSVHTIVDHLSAVHGAQSIALAIGPGSEHDPDPRRIGWADALDAAGLAPGRLVTTEWSREGGIRAAQQLFGDDAEKPRPGVEGADRVGRADRLPRPDAVIAGSDLIAIGLLRGAHDLGLRVPDDLLIISYDGTAESAFSVPRLTTMRQPVRDMARAAVDTLLDSPPQEAHHTSFGGDLIIRESCGCGTAGDTRTASTDARPQNPEGTTP